MKRNKIKTADSQPESFVGLGVEGALADMIALSGIRTPTRIQTETIPVAMSSRDVVGKAPSGTGKTLAFLLPLVQRLLKSTTRVPGKVSALVLAPTKELATQIAEVAKTLGVVVVSAEDAQQRKAPAKNAKSVSLVDFRGGRINVTGGIVPGAVAEEGIEAGSNLRLAVITGDRKLHKAGSRLALNPDIVVATPGKLEALLKDQPGLLKDVRIAVLDEADQLLDPTFVPMVERILRALPMKRQTMLFSATIPFEVQVTVKTFMTNPAMVFVGTDKGFGAEVSHYSYLAESNAEKLALLLMLMETKNPFRAIVFANTREAVRDIHHRLRQRGFDALWLTGDLTPAQRASVIKQIGGKAQVLVATDVGSRGIDFDDVTHVFNFNLPSNVDDYIHRAGRTCRGGGSGESIAFHSKDQTETLKRLEDKIKAKFAEVRVDRKALEPYFPDAGEEFPEFAEFAEDEDKANPLFDVTSKPPRKAGRADIFVKSESKEQRKQKSKLQKGGSRRKVAKQRDQSKPTNSGAKPRGGQGRGR
ncbi:MAG: DEAD/DEAH box helicase [Planctomycetes bacterium]|nr:DEAD/DEAH box helicase [Planctomycetota bacterium]